MKGKILLGLATLTMVITFSVTGVSAQMRQGHMGPGMGMGMQGQTGPCPWWEQGQMGTGMGMGQMGHGMMMGPGMGMRGMMGMMPGMMMGAGVDIEVKELKDGVTFTYRSKDENTAKRLRLMGEMMKLMQEMMAIQNQEK